MFSIFFRLDLFYFITTLKTLPSHPSYIEYFALFCLIFQNFYYFKNPLTFSPNPLKWILNRSIC